MNEASTAAQLAGADWFRSSYSAANNECVEMACARPWVGVRDSEEPGRGAFVVKADTFAVFIDGLKA
ncbi:DUF397 domain-containing protein [Streptomyces beigongshangae]|uniref:DUF397 domain-containing protein n=1 Tax=Streptomyces beigongshangae TaxID=2841597 RepID=UPI001C84C02F|nr:DUF397 domain-containing protein [Streptomyces sp. REN17]